MNRHRLAGALALLTSVPTFSDAAWTRHETASTIEAENGVNVVRGPKSTSGLNLDDELAGKSQTTIRIEKKVVVVNCFKPRRLTTHGFLGVRRYNRSYGNFGSPRFGFDDYERSDLTNC